MGEVIVVLGGLSVLYGVFDLLDYESGDEWKGIAFKIGGGAATAGIGLLIACLGI